MTAKIKIGNTFLKLEIRSQKSEVRRPKTEIKSNS